MKKKVTRRTALKLLASCAAGASVAGWPALRDRRHAWAQAGKKPYFSIVLTCSGGASIIDSWMPIRESESANASAINTFPDNEVIGDPNLSDIRAVVLSDTTLNTPGFVPAVAIGAYHANTDLMLEFGANHFDEMLVATYTGTSVNHAIAQKRSLTGNAAWRGRTLQEAVAAEYGEGFPIPNINMGFMGYLERGTDNSLPPGAFHEPVAIPYTFPLAMDGSRGIVGAPSKSLLDKARALRGASEDDSDFVQRVKNSDAISSWVQQREAGIAIETQDLITKLQYIPDIPPNIFLADYGLEQSPDGALINATFPNWLEDPFEAQAALAFLLIKYQVSCAITLGPNWSLGVAGGQFTQPTLAFDGSHGAHRYTQAVMWHRMLSIADRLIALLKAEVYDAGTGETFWDRSMIYFASEFGRTKPRQDDSLIFGSSHDLNNGAMIVSPLVNGNTVLGGVDPDTAMTYGWDPVTGAAAPGTTNSEGDVFAGILQALDIDTSGSSLPDVPAMKKA